MAADGAAMEVERTLQSKIAYTITAFPMDRRVAYLLNFAFQVRCLAVALSGWLGSRTRSRLWSKRERGDPVCLLSGTVVQGAHAGPCTRAPGPAASGLAGGH